MSEKTSDNFDVFELIVAILLGLSALGSAWAGFQSSLWGGNMSTSYAEAATTAIKAATDMTDAMINIQQDYNVDIKGKELLSQAKAAKSAVAREEYLDMANYLYTWQMSIDAYESLGLPPEKHSTNWDEDTDDLTEEELFDLAFKNDLDDEGNTYEEDMIAEALAQFKKADTTFEAGKGYNTKGDRFTLDGVIYTMALFFAGLALVFKTKIKWAFLGVGALIFLIATIWMFTMEWVAVWV